MSYQPPKGIPVGSPNKQNVGPQTSKKAITSLILGLASFICMFVSGMAAIILGIISILEVSKSNGRLKGQGMAITGIVLGVLGCLWTIPVIMTALLLPAVSQVRSAANIARSMNNLREITIRTHDFVSVHQQFPPAQKHNPELSWRVHLLPFLGEQELYEKFHLDEPWDSPHNLTLIEQMPDVYKNGLPGIGPGMTVYQMPTSPGSPEKLPKEQVAIANEGQPGTTFRDIRDGSSNTILILEVDPEAAVAWTKPYDWIFDPDNPLRSLGSQGSFAAGMADGAVQRFPEDIDPDHFSTLLTPSADDNGF